MKPLFIGMIFTIFAAPAFAGSNTAPPTEPTLASPEAAKNTGGDWTGFYAGVQLGYGRINSKILPTITLPSDNGAIYGIHAGYNYDFGRFVLGGELDYDNIDLSIGVATTQLDSVVRAKLRGGYDLGRTLLYVTGGYAQSHTSGGFPSSTSDGYFIGLGAAYQATNKFIISGEILEHTFDGIGGTAAVNSDLETITIRASYKF